jgi:hypothetical protein
VRIYQLGQPHAIQRGNQNRNIVHSFSYYP